MLFIWLNCTEEWPRIVEYYMCNVEKFDWSLMRLSGRRRRLGGAAAAVQGDIAGVWWSGGWGRKAGIAAQRERRGRLITITTNYKRYPWSVSDLKKIKNTRLSKRQMYHKENSRWWNLMNVKCALHTICFFDCHYIQLWNARNAPSYEKVEV